MPTAIKPEQRVLATLNADGSRRWLNPKQSCGPLWHQRRIVGWLLIAVFVAFPIIHINGRQFMFLDIARGEFTLLGFTLLRTDTLMFALTILTVFVTIFLLTALLGRVWCGWACPQTVYLEFVFRPIERLLDGKATGALSKRLAKLPVSGRVLARYTLYLIISFFLANVFLSYFVGSSQLVNWITGGPLAHPVGFGVVCFVTALMLFDFGFFREQLCMVACPYGRFQSVLLDKHSLIVGYDTARGEPRGRAKRTGSRPSASPDNAAPALTPDLALRVLAEPASAPRAGDCIDCERCVQVCPTGIDIRNGLQLECIHCAQCIDACNEIMTKLKRPRGLIRYSSQDQLAGGPKRWLRARTIVYPTLLVLLLAALVTLGSTKSLIDIRLMRGMGLPYNVLADSTIVNPARLRLTNRAGVARDFTLSHPELQIRTGDEPLHVEPAGTLTCSVTLIAPPAFFQSPDARLRGGAKERDIVITVRDQNGHEDIVRYRMIGPSHIAAPTSPEPGHD